jgi:hypothetical protein
LLPFVFMKELAELKELAFTLFTACLIFVITNTF